MRTYILNCLIYFIVEVLLLIGSAFTFKKGLMIMVIGLVIAFIPFCKDLVLLPIDVIIGKKHISGRFIGACKIQEYEFFNKGFSTWVFEVNNTTLALKNPLSVTIKEYEQIEKPQQGEDVDITYYKLSKMLYEWRYKG